MLIANPAAGRGAPEKIDGIRSRLLRAGCQVDVTVTGGRRTVVADAGLKTACPPKKLVEIP